MMQASQMTLMKAMRPAAGSGSGVMGRSVSIKRGSSNIKDDVSVSIGGVTTALTANSSLTRAKSSSQLPFDASELLDPLPPPGGTPPGTAGRSHSGRASNSHEMLRRGSSRLSLTNPRDSRD